MAAIDLHLHETEANWMPPVCARCGAKGRYVRAKTIVWWPWWAPLVAMLTGFIVFLPYIRLVFASLAGGSDTNRRVTIHLPFCARHRNHWRWRSWPLAGVMLAALGLIAAGIMVGTRLGRNQTGFLLVACGVLGLVLWGVLALLLPSTGIRITDLAGSALTLAGVSERFCQAVAKRRQQPPSANEEDLPRPKHLKTCSACGEEYSRGRRRCPQCGEANELVN
jgi:hypothetical protein